MMEFQRGISKVVNDIRVNDPWRGFESKDFLLLRNNKRFIFISTYMPHKEIFPVDVLLILRVYLQVDTTKTLLVIRRFPFKTSLIRALKITFRKIIRSASNFLLRPKNSNKATRTENILPHIAIVLMVIKANLVYTLDVYLYGREWKKSLSEIFNGIITSYKSNKQWSCFNENRFHFLWKNENLEKLFVAKAAFNDIPL